MHTLTLLAQDPSTTDQVLGLSFGLLGLVIALGALILFIAALVSILRSNNYTVAGKAVWVFIVLAFPFLGPVVWFVWGRRSSFAANVQNTFDAR